MHAASFLQRLRPGPEYHAVSAFILARLLCVLCVPAVSIKKVTKLFLGVDGGQSSTTALIGDSGGRVLGCGRGGPCNHIAGKEGRTKFVRTIRDCLQAACSPAGLDANTARFASACLGFSGGPEDKEAIVREMLTADRMTVTCDAPIALAGATAGGPGIIVIAGTGSIAFGRNAAGRTARAGGWGYIYGDEGGAFDIARRALRAVLRFEEGWGPPTTLHPMLLAETGAASANGLLHRLYTTEFSRPRIAALAVLVDRAAEQDDAVARSILETAAMELVGLASAVRRQLFPAGELVRLAHVGGAFRSEILRSYFCAAADVAGGMRAGPPVHGPAAGALLEAYRAEGLLPHLVDLPEEEK